MINGEFNLKIHRRRISNSPTMAANSRHSYGTHRYRYQPRHSRSNNDPSPATVPMSTITTTSFVQPLSGPLRVAFGVIAAFAVVLLMASVIAGHSTFRNSTASSKFTGSAPSVAPAVDEGVLDGSLVSADEVNSIMRATGMVVTATQYSFYDSGIVVPAQCLALAGTAKAQVYSGNGDTAMRAQILRAERRQDDGENFADQVSQAVVRFPSAARARDFFNTSAQQWAACDQFTDSYTDMQWTKGQLNTANGTLSAITVPQTTAPSGWGCERALATANNVIIDVETCSANAVNSAVKIAHRIAAKLPA